MNMKRKTKKQMTRELLEAAKSAYLRLLMDNSPSRFTPEAQQTLCMLRDSIADQLGFTAEYTQNDFEEQALKIRLGIQ
jgi:hypothetical protein